MRSRPPRTLDRDAAAVRRASQIVGWQITAAAAAMVSLIVTTSIVFIINQSQPEELLEKPRPGENKIYVDSRDVLVALLVVGLAAIVIAGLFSWVVASRAVRPLGNALRIQRAFVADASHELRTPLTVLNARIQLLQRRLPPGDPLLRDVADIRLDTHALVDVVNDLLLAATPEEPQSEPEIIDVNPVVYRSIESMQILADRRNVHIEFEDTRLVRASIPAASLHRCIVALLDNAIAHSPDDGAVTVALRPSKRTFDLVVIDHGSGVQGIDPGHIFDRFAHSAAPQRSPDHSRRGFGIGLALVRDIAVRHRGTVNLIDTSVNGTTIALTLPYAKPAGMSTPNL